MSKNSLSRISSSFSSGGGGHTFEHHVQAMYILSLLIDGFCPAMHEKTERIILQTKLYGYETDDLVVFTDRNGNEGKQLCQMKYSFSVDNNDDFKKVMRAAWKDFHKECFDKNDDRIALITSQISYDDLHSLRYLHDHAKAAADETDFSTRLNTAFYTSNKCRKVYTVIRNVFESDSDHKPTDNDLWHFFKVFIILLFDVDSEDSINCTLADSLIKCNSNYDAALVWSELVNYASYCDKLTKIITKNTIPPYIKKLFNQSFPIHIPFSPMTEIDPFFPIITMIGSWRDDNSYDCNMVAVIAGFPYPEFNTKARNMLIKYPEYLELENSTWRVKNKEQLLAQFKAEFFDDMIIRLFDASAVLLSQNSKRVMRKTQYYISEGCEYDNSSDIRNSLIQSVCWLKANLSDIPNCNHKLFEEKTVLLIQNLLKNAKWTTWANLHDCLQSIAELAPEEFLKALENNLSTDKQSFLPLFPKKNSSVVWSDNFISVLLCSLEVLAWSPEYLVRVVCTLGLLEALPYEHTNYVNTPINSITSILLPRYPQTLADIKKRKTALKNLSTDNPEVFWRVLNRLLPHRITATSSNPEPMYISLDIPEDLTVTEEEFLETNEYLLKLAIDSAGDDPEKQLNLVDHISYMNESALSDYLTRVENNQQSYDKDLSFYIWLKLRELLVNADTESTSLSSTQADRIRKLSEAFKPDDIRIKYRELYLGSRKLHIDKTGSISWQALETEKTAAVKDFFESYGAADVEQFAVAVNNKADVAYKLGQSISLSALSQVINECSRGVITEEFTVNCISSFVRIHGENSLLNTSLQNMSEDFIFRILTKIPFSAGLLNVVRNLLSNETEYWKYACLPSMFLDSELEEIKVIAENLFSCRRYITAVNTIGRSEFKGILSKDFLCRLLIHAGTENSEGSELFDKNSVQEIIEWLQKQGSISLIEMSEIEFIFLPYLASPSTVKPLYLYTRIATDPEFFCDMIELSFGRQSDAGHTQELNEAMSERLYMILLVFKITPGYDINGVFHPDVFYEWMSAVKNWSKENDRYEITMNTVGSGLAYAVLGELDLPEEAIMYELNKAENSELRHGYYLGTLNQREVHVIDPEGKPELALAEGYSNRADIVEDSGYFRYAETLRDIARHYSEEAKQNISTVYQS